VPNYSSLSSAWFWISNVRIVCWRATATKIFYCRISLDFVFIFQIYMSNFLLKQLIVKKTTLMIVLFCAKISPVRKFTTSSPWRWPSLFGRKSVIGRYLVWCGVWWRIIPKLVPSCFGLKIEYTFSIKHFVLVMCIETCQCIVLSRRTF